jgi:hypothetical protein
MLAMEAVGIVGLWMLFVMTFQRNVTLSIHVRENLLM